MGANHNTSTSEAAQAFIARWQGVTASELATAQSFVMDLCELLGVAKPHPTPAQDYMFERLCCTNVIRSGITPAPDAVMPGSPQAPWPDARVA